MTTETTTGPALDADGFLKPTDGAEGAGATLPPGDDAPPVRRGRGRPRKDAAPNFEAEKIPTGAKPGRKPKSASKEPINIDALSKQLVGIHMMIAGITKIPEAVIQPEEGVMMAQAIVNISEQYDLAIDGKTGAAIQLFATAAMIYAPRALHYKARMAQQQSGTVDASGQPS